MIKIIIKNGQPLFDNEASMVLYNRTIGAYSNTGKVLVMTIEEYSPNTTEQQHKLFKALLVKGSEVSGYTYKEFETELTDTFAPYKFQKGILGDMIKERKKVSEMSHKEFSIFIEQCIQFAAEFYDIKF